MVFQVDDFFFSLSLYSLTLFLLSKTVTVLSSFLDIVLVDVYVVCNISFT